MLQDRDIDIYFVLCTVSMRQQICIIIRGLWRHSTPPSLCLSCSSCLSCVCIADLYFCFVFVAYNHLSVEEQELELLRQFDLNADYGPCSGIICLHFNIVCQQQNSSVLPSVQCRKLSLYMCDDQLVILASFFCIFISFCQVWNKTGIPYEIYNTTFLCDGK